MAPSSPVKYVVEQFSPYISYVFIAVLVTLVASLIGFQLWTSSNTMPSAFVREGFAGPVKVGGLPDCMNSSDDSALIYSTFLEKASTTEEGADDLSELYALLGKVACLKRDLLSPGHLVSATKSATFYTMHDIEPVAETAARCFSKSIPVRDIEIIVDKWNTRGKMLLDRLCTSYSLTGTVQEKTKSLYKSVMADITEVLKTVCLKGEGTIAGMPVPRMVEGKEADNNIFLGQYKGYY
jgi:hypothetical protein